MTSIDRTAYPRFERMSARDVPDVFMLAAEEVAWAREKTTTGPHLLSLAAWLKSYQYLGYFPRLDQIPAAALVSLRAVLGLAEDVRCEVDADRTAKRQREFVRKRLGVVYDQAGARVIAEAAIRAAARSKDNPADLINVALEQLIRRRRELPAFSTLNEMAAAIRAEVNRGVFAAVSGRVPGDARARLLRLLVVDPAVRRSQFDRLKDPAKAATVGKLKARLAHLAALDAIGPTGAWLVGVPMAKVGHFAGEARLTDANDMGKVGEAKRLSLLASLVHTLRISARDEVTDMFCKRMAVIHRRGRERLEELREAHRAESERLLEVFGEVLAAAWEGTAAADDDATSVAGVDGQGESSAPDDEGRGDGGGDAVAAAGEEAARRTGELVLKVLEAGGGLGALTAAHEAVAAHHGNNYLPLVEQFYKSHRSVLFTLVDALELEATSAERAVVDAVAFIRANRDRRGEWIEESTVHVREGEKVVLAVDVDAFASGMWRTTLRDKRRPGMLARRHLEVCVFSHLAAELRSGDVAVVGSDSYANLYDQVMSWEECAPHAAEFCEQAGIPADAAALAAHYRGLLTKTAGEVDAGYPANTDLRLEGGLPVLARRKGAERRPSALALESRILERLPERSLLDILGRTAHLTGWHRHFGPPSGSDPKIRGDVMGRYVVTAFAYGGNLGPTEVARHMRGVSAHEISTAGNKHADPNKIHRASVDVIDAFAQLDVAGMWGDGRTAAADGSQIDTWENNLLAESHIRYGGFGGIAYRLVSDTYVALFSRFIPCGVWEAVYLLDLLLSNDSAIRPDSVHADTQGQSLPVFGLAALLGFDLLPRIRNWHDLVFHRPDPSTRYRHIDSLFGDHTIDWALIKRHWTDLLRTGISIREGRLSSVTLLRRLGNHSKRNRIYKALRELGCVVRTVTLLRYLSEPELREHITAVTNRTEAFHNYATWLMIGGRLIGHNDPDYQERVVKFNELIANAAIYSTALDITDAANALAAEGHPVDVDDLATISPYITRTIRRFGDWVLDLAPPEANPATRLDLQPEVLFPATG
ncbi:Tn3 family transposase [Yinghuangia sp. YIM S09857]|uniref:Tn3 family transposase n=1 Tax=Yinghuangia sp. YIM S09857 TaxID=3436929 RepID=UPI003F53D7F8